MALVKKPKKGLGRVGLFLDRKLKKHCKRVEDKVNEVHQALAPLRNRRAIPAAPRQADPGPATAEASTQRTDGSSSAGPATTFVAQETASQTTQAEEAADESEDLSTGSESVPLDVKDGLLHAPSHGEGRREHVASPAEDRGGRRGEAGARVVVEANQREKGDGRPGGATPLRDVSNNTPLKAAFPSPVAKEARKERKVAREVDEKDEAEEIFGRGPNAISVLLSACDCLDDDLAAEPYLTYDVVDMMISAGELVSKGWNDADLLSKGQDLFKMAALEGSIVAARCLGLFKVTGIAGDRNEAEARNWFGLGASNGDAISTIFLAEMEELGLGGPSDTASAALHYKAFSDMDKKSRKGSALMVDQLFRDHTRQFPTPCTSI
mmetsp:Transcript_13015/g.36516  ORF Transcript_13015/g.36516 Transcript_13015/m.36516 type:complete len:380 (-) Transcript_13015:18-1157(-)